MDKNKVFSLPDEWIALKPIEKLMIIICLKPESFEQAGGSMI